MDIYRRRKTEYAVTAPSGCKYVVKFTSEQLWDVLQDGDVMFTSPNLADALDAIHEVDTEEMDNLAHGGAGMNYYLTNTKTKQTTVHTDLQEVADLMGLELEDVKWALFDEQRCDAAGCFVVPEVVL